MLMTFLGEKNCPIEIGPKMAVCWENWGQNLTYWFGDPKGTSLCGTASFVVLCVEIGARVSAVAFLKNPPPKKNPSHFVPRGVKSRMRRTETPKPIWIKFCKLVDITDLVNNTNFDDHRLRGFWLALGTSVHALGCKRLEDPKKGK